MNNIVPFTFGIVTGLCIVLDQPASAFFVFLAGVGMYFVMEART